MKEAILRRARELGFDECRSTTAQPPESGPQFERWLVNNRHGTMEYLRRNGQKRVDPQKVLAGAKSILTLAVSYGTTETLASIPGCLNSNEESTSHCSPSGLIARYARYQDYHEVIGTKLRLLTEFMDELGGPEGRSLWYVDTGPLLERDLAQRAGLGFIGKHTNLINRKLGNWIFLAEIITTLELTPDPPETNRCGSCTRCLDACPTAAITAPFHLDARRCISYLTIELKGTIPVEFRPAIGNRIYGCDDCLAACPWNRFAHQAQMMKAHARPELSTPDLLDLITLDSAAFAKRFSGTPIARAKRTGLVRNCCVALGNVGDETALPALEHASRDPEPIIAEHARWAIEQIIARSQRDRIGTEQKLTK